MINEEVVMFSIQETMVTHEYLLLEDGCEVGTIGHPGQPEENKALVEAIVEKLNRE